MIPASQIPVKPLPVVRQTALEDGLSLLLPLSRRGVGPGMIVLVPSNGNDDPHRSVAIRNGVPWPMIKWAEESYTVVEVQASALAAGSAAKVLARALQALEECAECQPKKTVGLVGKSLLLCPLVFLYSRLIAYVPSLYNEVAPVLDQFSQIKAVAVYATVHEVPQLTPCSVPTIKHLAGTKSTDQTAENDKTAIYDYPGMTDSAFATPFQPSFNYTVEAVSHSRTLGFFKPRMGCPYFDLEAIWDEHTYWEFVNRSVEHTMSTMVQEPYVNHVTTITGGVGRERLTHFYRHHFIFCNPEDADLELVSRTIGVDRVVDEFNYKLTHDRQVDWL